MMIIPDDVSFVSETDTPTLRKLAYAAPTHPIRLYEQALSTLIARFDDIVIHGNAEVSNSRKAVVARVEGALEKLVQKVDARWNKWNKSHRAHRVEEDVEEFEKQDEVSGVSSSPQRQVQAGHSPPRIIIYLRIVQGHLEISQPLPTFNRGRRSSLSLLTWGTKDADSKPTATLANFNSDEEKVVNEDVNEESSQEV
ncbi:hypothetical protein FB446DRAFT_815909 [Lentinula raphanica]|nr:hypothetical protein FB446DRAFT_815909 [Lentinula raphanica]